MDPSLNSGLPAGYRLYQADDLPSTNLWMRERAGKALLTDRSVLLAKHQSQGKGQGSNLWYDAPGESLLASIYLKTLPFRPNEIFFLNMAVSLSLYQSLSVYTKAEIRIKWPNDILIQQKKVAGILIENQWRGEGLQHSIVGLGVNLLEESFPEDLPYATSVRIESGVQADTMQVLQDFCTRLDRMLKVADALSGRKWLQESYHDALWRLYEEVTFRYGDQRYRGLIQEVKPDGGIVLVTKGKLQTFYHGEIKLIRF